jgi:Ca2+-binding EF-hand superfamily protein
VSAGFHSGTNLLEDAAVKRTALSAVALMLTASLANAQPPAQPGPGGDFRPPNPFMLIFDADQDGKISADELKQASESLAKLDENKNGSIEADELPQPQRSSRGFGGGPGGTPGQGGRGNFDLAAQFQEWDKDKDGKVSESDMPEQMRRMFGRFDANMDKFVSKEEMDKAIEEFRSRFGQGRRPGGDGDRRRPDGDSDGDNPRPDGGRRPERPDA